ncbi:hypothetical protein TIFTF001_010154 [Ficus carica]|uniref:Pectinesterase inhibitor domain-containing protein n=1 Tax=Ficus carica TaxID=3494 RepID=A0AA88D364_FICCA|nr:hypothetical protein TIFTF001_010154 [Ficus carica]
MESHSFPTLLFSFLLIFFISIPNVIHATSATSSSSSTKANKLYVRQSCNSTLYPKDCYKFLSSYSSKIKSNPYKLCEFSIYVAYVNAKAASSTATRLAKTKGLTAPEKGAITDCVENFKDSVDELKQSWDDMDKIINGAANGTMSDDEKNLMVENVKTWASAALTDDDTCKDEIDEVKANPTMKSKLSKAILKVAKSTSICLAFVNSYYS